MITPLTLSRIPKLEFPRLVKGFFEVMDKYGPDDHHVRGIYNLLDEKKSLLGSLKYKYTKLPQTDELRVLREKRKDVLKAIQKQKQSMIDANIASMASNMKLIIPFLNEYFGNILASSTEGRTTRIEQMFVALDANVELKAALTAVGLTVYIEELRTVQQQINLKIVERRTHVSELPKMVTKQVKAELTVAITDLRNAIELAAKEHPEVDYLPLVNEINALFVPFQAKIKSQNTRRKTAVAASKVADVEKIKTDDQELKSA